MFELTIGTEIFEEDGSRFYVGRIRLGEFAEDFRASAALWLPDCYQAQWRAAAKALTSGAVREAFVTSFANPDASYNVVWPAWRVGATVYVQNRLVFRDQLEGPFNPNAAAEVVGDRELFSEDGSPLSEWAITVDDLAVFTA